MDVMSQAGQRVASVHKPVPRVYYTGTGLHDGIMGKSIMRLKNEERQRHGHRHRRPLKE